MSVIKYRDLTFSVSVCDNGNYRLRVEQDTVSVDGGFIRSSAFRFSSFPALYLALSSFTYLIYGEVVRFDTRDVRNVIDNIPSPTYTYSVEED